ncbi:MAG: PqqD family protein [Candidatus Izemoplasmatales bacterium]|nr:PqqD family protein [Candidatus Izemoplasmatales bacterium]
MENNYCLSKHISWQMIDDSIVIIDERTEKVKILNESASDFWITFIKFFNFNEALLALSQKYSVTRNEIEEDFHQLLYMLVSNQVLYEC